MKEFEALTGGRYTYADDIKNLQDLALSINNIFDGCGDFIVSGCDINETKLTSGFVFLGGKLRRFDGANITIGNKYYIAPNDIKENVNYKNGLNQLGRTIYGCRLISDIPDTSYIAINTSNPSTNKTLKSNFIGKYALLLDSPFFSQTINSELFFNKKITFKERINCHSVSFNNDNVIISGGLDNGLLINLSNPALTKNCIINIQPELFEIAFTSKSILQFTFEQARFSVPVFSQQIQTNSVTLNNANFDKTEISFDKNGLYIIQEFGDYTQKIQAMLKNISILSSDGDLESKMTLSPNTISFVVSGQEQMSIADDGVWINAIQCDSGVLAVGGKIKEQNVLLEKKYVLADNKKWKNINMVGGFFYGVITFISAYGSESEAEQCTVVSYNSDVKMIGRFVDSKSCLLTVNSDMWSGIPHIMCQLQLSLPIREIDGINTIVSGYKNDDDNNTISIFSSLPFKHGDIIHIFGYFQSNG